MVPIIQRINATKHASTAIDAQQMEDMHAMLKTRSQVRQEFANKGLSISGWAKSNGYSPNMVIAILADKETNPRLKCLRGDAHNIAVQLGIKEGQVTRPANGRPFVTTATA